MSKNKNPFILDADDYKRDIGVLNNAVKDTANYLHMSTGKDFKACVDYVRKQLAPGGRFAYVDKKITFLERTEEGDRAKREEGLATYFQRVVKTEEILSPTGTTYLNPKVKRSLLADYQKDNVALRGVAKKQKFTAEMDGNYVLMLIKDLEQGNAKTANNSVSGMHLSPSNPLYNKTAHSSLTSTCRVTSGYGNANNEKFLSGNRHYYNHHVVLSNMTVLSNNVDLVTLEKVIIKYDLTIPTVKDVIDCIEFSTQLYWSFPDFEQNRDFQKIIRLAKAMSPLQRASFIYTGDFYQLLKHNEDFTRSFLSQLSRRVTEEAIENPLKAVYEVSESIRHLGAQLCQEEMRDIGSKYVKIENKEGLNTFVATCFNIQSVIFKYSDLIRAMWVTPNVPASVAWFPTSTRRSALVSDTDSTIFTVQDWVKWYCGKICFTLEAMQIAATMIFLTSETITHVLAMMSVNIGVEKCNLHLIAMKNEFKFDVLVPTQIGKHYYANNSCQEGNIFKDWKMEIKGVGLKSSSAPKEINDDATKMMKNIIKDVMENDAQVSLHKYLGHVAKVEQMIFKSLANSETNYLRSGNLKDAASYSNPDALKTPYQQHVMWNEVFGPKYGLMIEPPYSIFKVSVNTLKPRAMKLWLDRIEDKEFSARMRNYLKRVGKTSIGTFNVPQTVLDKYGIPDEIKLAMDARKIVTDICRIYALILETLGVFLYEKKIKRLTSDIFPAEWLDQMEDVKLERDPEDEGFGDDDEDEEEVEEVN